MVAFTFCLKLCNARCSLFWCLVASLGQRLLELLLLLGFLRRVERMAIDGNHAPVRRSVEHPDFIGLDAVFFLVSFRIVKFSIGIPIAIVGFNRFLDNGLDVALPRYPNGG